MVAAPHDVTGPPIGMAALASECEVAYVRPAAESLPLSHRDAEVSLLWVAYAAQVRREYHSSIQPVDPAAQPSNHAEELLEPMVHEDDEKLYAPDSDLLARPAPLGAEALSLEWLTIGQRRGSASQRRAQDVLGEVEGEALLGEMY